MAPITKLLVYSLASVLLVLLLLPLVDPYNRVETLALVQWNKLFKRHSVGISYPEVICTANKDESPWTFYRVQFGSGPGVTVYGWPAKGGLYVLRDCTGLELDFLGLSRFEDELRPGYDPSTGRPLRTILNGSTSPEQEQEQDQKQRDEEEERHCDKMRMLGARWYRSSFALGEEEFQIFAMPSSSSHDMPYIKTGWPSSGKGVWIPNTTLSRAIELGAGRIYNARDMDERCRIIESIGGVYFSDPKESGLDIP